MSLIARADIDVVRAGRIQMKRWLKRIGLGLVIVVLVLAASVAIYAKTQSSAFDDSMNKVYDIPVPTNITRSTDPAVIARGKHLAESSAACALNDCHGPDLSGGRAIAMGPVATITGPNVSMLQTVYSDGELARMLRHGIKKDGRSLRLMPSQDFNWMPDSDIIAIISWMRTMPPIDKPNGVTEIKTLGKVLDRREAIPLDVARHIDHDRLDLAGPPEPTAAYGRFLARSCQGCHGKKFSGGPIPGAPSSMAVPLNLTPDASGLKGFTYDDFDHLLQTGTRKDGRKLDPMMDTTALSRLDDVEKHALFAFLQSLPPVPYGNR
jgi:cytochrome c553